MYIEFDLFTVLDPEEVTKIDAILLKVVTLCSPKNLAQNSETSSTQQVNENIKIDILKKLS